MAELTPNNPSSDYNEMAPYWAMIDAILDGTPAMRAAGEKYLPKFDGEANPDYEFRRRNAKFTNIYRDIVEALAAKPFSKEVALVDGSASTAVQEFCEDVDGRGNHLHVFAANLFFTGINKAVDWILIDKPPVPEGAVSRQDEASLGVRPYWVRIPADNLIAVYSATIGGQEQIVHARILENTVVREGYGEKTIKRVRIFDRDVAYDADGVASAGPASFQLWEEVVQTSGSSAASKWIPVAGGLIAIGIIPLIPFITGRRKAGSWCFNPPMQDAAYTQVEHYKQENALQYAADNTAFPMLAGNGVTPMIGRDGKPLPVPVGPKRVLYAPPAVGDSTAHGEWAFIEPSGTSLTFLAEQIKSTEKQLRELGRQPLTADTGNLTVVTTVFAAQKGNTAIQAWALNLKDALEKALQLTCLWLADSSEPEVSVYTDFAIDVETDRAVDVLLAMRANKDISREALINEAKRRDWLSPEYDAEEDEELIVSEGFVWRAGDGSQMPGGQAPNAELPSGGDTANKTGRPVEENDGTET